MERKVQLYRNSKINKNRNSYKFAVVFVKKKVPFESKLESKKTAFSRNRKIRAVIITKEDIKRVNASSAWCLKNGVGLRVAGLNFIFDY